MERRRRGDPGKSPRALKIVGKHRLKRINKTCYQAARPFSGPRGRRGSGVATAAPARAQVSSYFQRGSTMKVRIFCWVVFVLCAQFAIAQPAPRSSPRISKLPLAEGWTLASSSKVDQSGEVLSRPAFQPRNWYPVSVPTTVVSALVKHKVLPDPFFGMNLRQFPGV